MKASDVNYMAEAIRLARQGLYSTKPNPRVGCVLVKDDVVVGRGWHQRAGQAHAEINAIADAGDQACGACAYVTLEPCSHFGKTGPCSEALVAAQVSRVVVAMQDPNPLVAGRGIERLRQAGVDVEVGVLEAEAEALNPGFIKRMREGLPFVRIKLAMSLDGRTAMASGESQWITGASARADVQHLRARSSAVITGRGTLEFDDPSLVVRQAEIGLSDEEFARLVQPERVILDSQAKMQASAKAFKDDAKLLHLSSKDRPSGFDTADIERFEAQYEWQGLSLDQRGHLPVRGVLELLAKREANEVLIESGPMLAGAFFQAGLCDELVVYMAPKLMGSQARPLMVLPFDNMSDSVALNLIDVRMLGDDLRLTYRPTF